MCEIKRVTVLTVMAGGGLLLCASAYADVAKKGPNQGEKGTVSESATGVRTLILADELADYGIKAGDPVAIIEAAKMKKSVSTKESKAAKTGGATPAPAAKTGGTDLSADALLVRADSMAGSNAALKGLIADARATHSRGATRGPGVHGDTVLAGRNDVYSLTFHGGEVARVGVVGDHSTDLDLYVYDENGNQVCADDDYTDVMYCSWTPRWTGSFTVKIVNRGGVYNDYRMVWN